VLCATRRSEPIRKYSVNREYPFVLPFFPKRDNAILPARRRRWALDVLAAAA
jgi:hypothetical protein